MSDSKLLDLAVASALDGTEAVYVVQGGTDAQTTTEALATLVGSSRAISAVVDFGAASQQGDIASVTVAADWVTATTKIVCAPFAVATALHDPDDYAVEGITAYASNIVNGVGFDIIARAPNRSFGTYQIHAIAL